VWLAHPRSPDVPAPDRIAARPIARQPATCTTARLSQNTGRPVTKGPWGVSSTDRAHQNSEYVRRLLKKKCPEFAAVLERVVGELTRPCVAPSAESPAFELPPGAAGRRGLAAGAAQPELDPDKDGDSREPPQDNGEAKAGFLQEDAAVHANKCNTVRSGSMRLA
jgi:hypothetical protein